jgi:hypothetical protein
LIASVTGLAHGGLGASGFGKDMSATSLEEYLTIKHVMSALPASPTRIGTERFSPRADNAVPAEEL